MRKLLAKAIEIATQAHRGQFDKGGMPYILHPIWVMNKVRHHGILAMIVGILHDTVEDTDITIEYLAEKGFPEEVLEALELLDFRDTDYKARIKLIFNTNELARIVKLADLEHNMKPQRLKGLRPKDLERMEKYHWSFMYLSN